MERARPKLEFAKHAVDPVATVRMRSLLRLPRDLDGALASVQMGDTVTDKRAAHWRDTAGNCVKLSSRVRTSCTGGTTVTPGRPLGHKG